MKRIEEFSDNELLEELSKRFDDFIMAARKVGYQGKDQAQRRRYWSGDMDVCVGLLHGAIQDCLNKNWGIRDTDISY